VETSRDPRAAAVGVLRRALRPGAELPGMVFAEEWGSYLLFDPGRIFLTPNFVPVAQAMLEGTGDGVIAIAALREWESGIPESECLWFFDRETTPEDWKTKVIADGWSVMTGGFCLAPDTGNWCIYSEYTAELAVLAIRDRSTRNDLAPAILGLDAVPVEEAWERKTLFCFYPAHAVRPEWPRGLRENYGESRKRA
jgi:hypothetical protein